MNARLLLDTHVLLRWVAEAHRLSREQRRVLRIASQRGEPLAISALSLLELAQMSYRGLTQLKFGVETAFEKITEGGSLQILPLTIVIAQEAPPLAATLRDPVDCVIVATARVHGLRLLTSDQRIIDSKLAVVID